jgi:hypothetical protein
MRPWLPAKVSKLKKAEQTNDAIGLGWNWFKLTHDEDALNEQLESWQSSTTS